MECLIEVLSYIDKFDQDAYISSIFAPFDKDRYNKDISKAVKSYMVEANRLIVTLLSFHTGVSDSTFTETGWRNEKEYKKSLGQAGHVRKSSSVIPGLELTISSLREIGALLSLHAKVLNHLKIKR
jgi:hypothetical protein